MRRGGGRRAVAWCLAVAALATADPGRADSSDPRVRLEVVNAGAGHPMRCVLILAHFVTLEAGRAEPGQSFSLTLERAAGDGTLSVRGETGRKMAVENLLCGAGENWSETRSDVPLAALRDPAIGEVRAACVLAGRLRCYPLAP